MRPGSHAAADGSFGRSTGMAAGRGALLLAIAVGLGIILLNAADDAPSGTRVVSRDRGPTPTTAAPGTARITTTTLPLRAPEQVKVLAANATRIKGAASKVTDTLRTANYNVLAPTDAPSADQSIVYFALGYERDAVEIARLLGLPPAAVAPMPEPPPVSDLRAANALVVVGPDLAGPEPVTTTTRPRTTTTAAKSSTSTTAKASSTTTTARATSTTARPTSTTARPATTTTTR
ncbi:MAG TPA: LytR C-terminal domain-containing protein [Acidimicrobiales bacterium]|nr:LytR C-terminal domain-containing protein [Acidimicrobiales bacterium]